MLSPDVVALSPVACAAVVWRVDGALRVTVVVKATFALVPDQDARLVGPAPIEREDRYLEQDPARSLRFGNDLAPYLGGAGVVLVGHAHAPGGRAVTGLSARLGIYGEEPLVDKTIHVYGDVAPGGSGPAPFVKMPLVYERAYGGPSVPSNPVGVGSVDARRPNLVHPTNPHRPAGFGPIAPRWPSRRRLFADLELRAGEILALPAGLDFRAFNAAPVDQQIPELTGAEWIVLDNLLATGARVRTRLPSAQARARWSLASSRSAEQEVALDADTLAIDTDQQTATVLWRGSFALDGPALLAQVRLRAGLDLPGQPTVWPAPVAVGHAAPGLLSGTATSMMSPFAQPALPFEEGSPLEDPVTVAGPSRPAPAIAVPGAPWSGVAATRAAAPEEHTVFHVMAAPEEHTVFHVMAAPEERTVFHVMAAPEERTVFHVMAAPEPAPRARVVATLAAGGSFDGADLSGADLSALDFTGRSLRGCQLRGAILRGATLTGAQLQGADLTGAQLDGAQLGEAVLEEAKLGGASFGKATLDGARLGRAQGEGASFDGASLRRADLRNASFPRASFAGAVLCEAQADQGDFTGARFLRADLGAASFRKAKLTLAVLAHAVLDGTDLRNADLERANVHGTTRRTAKMAGANTRDLDESPPPDPGT